jgi:hypothetical protein
MSTSSARISIHELECSLMLSRPCRQSSSSLFHRSGRKSDRRLGIRRVLWPAVVSARRSSAYVFSLPAGDEPIISQSRRHYPLRQPSSLRRLQRHRPVEVSPGPRKTYGFPSAATAGSTTPSRHGSSPAAACTVMPIMLCRAQPRSGPAAVPGSSSLPRAGLGRSRQLPQGNVMVGTPLSARHHPGEHGHPGDDRSMR